MKDLKQFIAKGIDTVANTLADFISEGQKQGFQLAKKKGENNVIHLSKAGFPQIMFVDNQKQRMYLRISANLDAALKAGEKVNVIDSPVYEANLDNGGKMLVIGLAGDDAGYEVVDAKTAFGKLQPTA